MNIKGNLKYVIIGSILFLLVYMFVAAIPMGSDIYFEPAWTKDITKAVTTDPAKFKDTSLEGFSLGNRFGYFTADGTILSSTLTDARVTISPDAWATYPENAATTDIFNPDGTKRITVAASGFTHLDGGRTYLFLPGGDAVSQYDDSGKKMWTREHTAPITAFNSSPKGTVIGYADGQITALQSDGSEIFSFYPEGSDYQVILGVALSEDGTLAACVCGIDKQRFLLIHITNGQYKVVFHTWLEGNLHRQAYVDFEKSGKYAFFEYSKGIGIVDCVKRSANLIPSDGEVVNMGEYPGNNLFLALVKNGTSYTLEAIERPDHLIATTRFTAQNAFLIQRNEAIFLGMDDRISRINIRGIQ